MCKDLGFVLRYIHYLYQLHRNWRRNCRSRLTMRSWRRNWGTDGLRCVCWTLHLISLIPVSSLKTWGLSQSSAHLLCVFTCRLMCFYRCRNDPPREQPPPSLFILVVPSQWACWRCVNVIYSNISQEKNVMTGVDFGFVLLWCLHKVSS